MDCSKEEFEDTKGVIRIRKAKKDRQHNGQNKKDKQRSTKHTHKSKDRVTRKPLKTEGLVVSVRFRIFNLRSQQTQTTMYVKHCDYPSKKKYKSVLYPSTVIPLSIRNFSI